MRRSMSCLMSSTPSMTFMRGRTVLLSMISSRLSGMTRFCSGSYQNRVFSVFWESGLLRAVVPNEFSAVLVKGRNNYVSLRRLKLASERQDRLFSDDNARRALHALEDWAYMTDDGSLSSLPSNKWFTDRHSIERQHFFHEIIDCDDVA